jgi:hypothetical protein
LFDIHANAIHPIETHHDYQTSRSANAHPSSRKVHHLELVCCYQTPRLSVGNGDKCFTLASHFVNFDVLSRPLVKYVLMVYVLVGNGGCVAPHDVS